MISCSIGMLHHCGTVQNGVLVETKWQGKRNQDLLVLIRQEE
jgi:hypothetical protein